MSTINEHYIYIYISSGLLVGKKGTRLSKSDIRVQIVHSDHNAARGNDDEEDVKEPMVSITNSVAVNA